MKIQIVAALTVAASLFVATAGTQAGEWRVPPKDSFLLEVTGVKALDKAVDERAVVLMEVAAKMGIEPDRKFKGADDLANILLVTSQADQPVPASDWILIIGEATGFLMN